MNWEQKAPQLVQELDAEHARPRCAAFLAALALVALWAWSASLGAPVPAGCETDSDCEAQCRIDLRPDEDESICDVEA